MTALLDRLKALARHAVELTQTDPALVAAIVQAVLAFCVTAGLNLTPGETGAIEAAASALAGLATAWYVRPFRTAAAVAFVSALGTVLVAFQVPHVTAGAVSAFSVLVTGILNLAVTSPQTASLKVLRERAAMLARQRM